MCPKFTLAHLLWSFLNWFAKFVIIIPTEFTCFIFKPLICFYFVCFVALLCQFCQVEAMLPTFSSWYSSGLGLTTGESSRYGRQERSGKTSTLHAKLPHVVMDWLPHLGDVGQSCPHPFTSHCMSSLCFFQSVCNCGMKARSFYGSPSWSVEDKQGYQFVFKVSWFSSQICVAGRRLLLISFFKLPEIVCLAEFPSGLLISKSRVHSPAWTLSPAPSVISGWWLFSDRPLLPLRVNFVNFSHNCRRSQPHNSLLLKSKSYRHEMKKLSFPSWTKSLISTFLLFKLVPKWTWLSFKYHFRILSSMMVDSILRRCYLK